MFQFLPLSIGLRYLRAKRRNGFISFISAASIMGITIGVISLIVTISVMSGFQEELRSRILGMVAHATVTGLDGPLHDWTRAIELADADDRVIGAAPYVETQALLQGSTRRGAVIRGVVPDLEERVSTLADKMVVGSLADLKPGAFQLVVGRQLADALELEVGDPVNIFVAEDSKTLPGLSSVPRAKRFTVSGIFQAGVQEYDAGLAIIHLQDAQTLSGLGDGVSGVRLKLRDMWDARPVARDLDDKMVGYYGVRDWSQDHANFFHALKLEKTVMFVLLSLVIAIAAFNLVSSLVMLVQDKQSDIAILRTLGMSPGAVMAVFVVQGMVIGMIGILGGVVGGVLLGSNLSHVVAFVERLAGAELMPADVYFIGGVPSVVDAGDVAKIALIAFALCLLATLYPAWRAARTDPANALRYE